MKPYQVDVVNYSEVRELIESIPDIDFDRNEFEEDLGKTSSWGDNSYYLVSDREFCDTLRNMGSLSQADIDVIMPVLIREIPFKTYINMEG